MNSKNISLVIFLSALSAATLYAQQTAKQISASQNSAPQPTAQAQSTPTRSGIAQIAKLAKIPTVKPCFARLFENTQAHEQSGRLGTNSALATSYPLNELPQPCGALAPVLVKVTKPIDWFARFVTGPEVKPLSPYDKAHLALRNLFDPFNALTILGQSGISVASDSHSPYGPGMPGFGRNVGVSFTQDMTGQFFDTFLIPSIMHQDPHYHRRPDLTIKRRILHTAIQVLWTKGDNGQNMPNYSNIIGGIIDDELGNLYVPGRQTNLTSSAARYGVNLATAPADNLITEFLPDIARRIHIHDVFIQHIINSVAKSNQ